MNSTDGTKVLARSRKGCMVAGICAGAVSEDSDGQLIRFSWRSVPGGLITEHIHPRQEERFIITEGEAPSAADRPQNQETVMLGGRHRRSTARRDRIWQSAAQPAARNLDPVPEPVSSI